MSKIFLFFLYQALGMSQEAIACYQHALQTRPNYGMAYGGFCFFLLYCLLLIYFLCTISVEILLI